MNLHNFLDLTPDKLEYHLDLLRSYGVRYVWTGRMTHILGQDARPNVQVKAKNALQKLLYYTRYRNTRAPLFDLKNRLMIDTRLQDGSRIWDFQRWVNAWGRERVLNIHDLAEQLKPRNIDALLRNEGFLVIYTHMCEGLFTPEMFPEKLKQDLRYLARLYHEGKLLVTTTARLLKYKEVHDALRWRTIHENGITKILIQPFIRALGEKIVVSKKDLSGITFLCQDPEKVQVIFKGEILSIKKNPKDFSGTFSVSVPWHPLEYPRAR